MHDDLEQDNDQPNAPLIVPETAAKVPSTNPGVASVPQGGRSMAQQSPADSPSGVAEGQGRRVGAGAIASLTGAGLLLVFMIQNREDVTLDFLVWSFTWPLWLLTLVTALIGAVVWIGLGVMRRHRRHKARREDRRG